MRVRAWVLAVAAFGQALMACDAILGNLEDRAADGGGPADSGARIPDATTHDGRSPLSSGTGSGPVDSGHPDSGLRDAAGPVWTLAPDTPLQGVVAPAAFAGITGSDPVYFGLSNGDFIPLGSGGPPAVACDQGFGAGGLAAMSSQPYAVTMAGYLAVASSGSCQTFPLPMYAGGAWTVGRGSAYWAGGNVSDVFTATPGPSWSPTTYASTPLPIVALAYDEAPSGTGLWLGTEDRSIYHCTMAFSCQSFTAPPTGMITALNVVSSGGRVFVSVGTTTGLYVLESPFTDAAISPPMTSQLASVAVGTIATYPATPQLIFWSQPSGSEDTIFSAQLPGSNATAFAHGPGRVIQIDVTGNAIVWVTENGLFAATP